MIKIEIFFITDRSNAVLLVWFSMLLVLVSVSVLFSSICLDDIKLGLGLCFWKELFIQLTVFSLRIVSICIFCNFPF